MKNTDKLIDFCNSVQDAIRIWFLVLFSALVLLFCVVEYEIMGVVDLSRKGLRLVSPLVAINVVCGAVYFLGQMRDNNVSFVGVCGYIAGLCWAVSIYCLIHNALFPIATKGFFAACFCYCATGILLDIIMGIVWRLSAARCSGQKGVIE